MEELVVSDKECMVLGASELSTSSSLHKIDNIFEVLFVKCNYAFLPQFLFSSEVACLIEHLCIAHFLFIFSYFCFVYTSITFLLNGCCSAVMAVLWLFVLLVVC